jgi:uncharacterized protein (TIGR03437 family)
MGGAPGTEAQVSSIVTDTNKVFLTSVNGSDPGTQTVRMAGVPSGTVVSVQGYTTTGGIWMTLNIGSISRAANFNFTFTFTGSETLNISANPSGLPLGNYLGFIILTAGPIPAVVSVSYGVFPTGTITLIPPNLALKYPSSSTQSQVQVTNVNATKPQPNVPVSTRVDYLSGKGWLNVTQSGPTTPATVTITTNPAGLNVNQPYQAYVTVDAGSVGNDVVAVTLDVQSQPLSLVVTPSSPFSFTYQLGGQPPPSQTLVVSGSGGNFPYTITATSSWLKANPSSGQTPATVTVSIDPTTLSAPGPQQANLSIAGPAGTLNSPAIVPVNLQVQAAPPKPQLTQSPPGALAFSYVSGGPFPDAQTVSLGSSAGSLSFSAAADQSWISVSPFSGATPSMLKISVNPGSNPPNTYKGNVTISSNDAGNTPFNIPIQMTISAARPTITENVQNGASFVEGIAPQSWVTIKGTNLAPTARTWRSDEVINGILPTQLDGVSVSINSKPAYVYYISPTQINVISPADATAGPVPVQVTSGNAASATVIASLHLYAPGLFRDLPSLRVVAFHQNGDLVGPASQGGRRPATSGETLTLFGTGFGPTNPVLPQGVVPVPGLLYKPSPVVIRVNGVAANADAALVNYAAVYQINVTLPAGLPNGELPIVAEVGGASSPDGFTISVQN